MARTSGLARGTILGVGAQVWQLATAFFLYHFVMTTLGLTLFGQWRVVLSVLNSFELLAYTGLAQAASKRLAERPQESPLLERAAYLGQGVLAAGLFAVALIAAGPIAAALGDPSLAWLIRLSCLDIPLVALLMIAGSVLLGQRRFERQAVGMFVYATAKALAIGFLVWRGFSVPGALIGNALSSLVGFAVMFGPWEGLSVEFRQTVAEARGMGIAGVPFLAQNVIVGITSHVDLWFVQAIIGGVAVGLYGAAAALAEIPAFLLAALSRGLLPSVARADAENDEQLVGRYATQGVRLALLVTILGVAVVAATGRALLSFVYLPAVAGAAVPFTILMIAAAGANVRDTCADVLLARDRRRSVLWIAGASLGLAAALLLVLTPRYGIAGAAWAAAIASLAAGAATAYTLRKSISGRVLLTLLRASAAAAIVGVALAFIGPVRLWLLIAYPVAAVAYVALLLLMREFDDADVAAVRGAISRGA